MFLDKDAKPFNGRKDKFSESCVKNNTYKKNVARPMTCRQIIKSS